MDRARAIIIQNEKVALMKRQRDGATYYVFPGGKVEPGETPEEAVAREVEEELGLIVRPHRMVAVGCFGSFLHRFYLVDVLGGSFGGGTGPEVRGLYPAERGSYTPTWLEFSDLLSSDVRPREVAGLVVEAQKSEWPTAPRVFEARAVPS